MSLQRQRDAKHAGKKTPTFTQWLKQQRRRDDPIGDLARDVCADPDFPVVRYREDVVAYLGDRADGRVGQALDRAWRAYGAAYPEAVAPQPGAVYVVQAVDTLGIRIMIGHAAGLTKQTWMLRHGRTILVTIRREIAAPDAPRLVAWLHAHYADYCGDGGWFELPEEELNWLLDAETDLAAEVW